MITVNDSNLTVRLQKYIVIYIFMNDDYFNNIYIVKVKLFFLYLFNCMIYYWKL